jgi:hypothetical protein
MLEIKRPRRLRSQQCLCWVFGPDHSVMCPSERGPPAVMRLLTPSATKRSMTQKAETIRSQGVLSPLLVRPKNERSFEIVFGARRFRAAQMAEVEAVPVRIKHMSDAEVVEAQLIENLPRRDVHLLEEAQGFSFASEFGGAEIQRRTDRGEDGKNSRLCCNLIMRRWGRPRIGQHPT